MSESTNGRAPLIEVRNVSKRFRLPGGWLAGRRYVSAVKDVSFTVAPGEVFGLVGESGCGKTTLMRLILKLIDVSDGAIYFDGQNLAQLQADTLRTLRRRMQVVFQNPVDSLSPRQRVLDIVAEPLKTHTKLSKAEQRASVLKLLEQVGLSAQHLDRFPHEMSGGQCQRVAIARALALEPQLLILDEPTSALDVSVQAQILNLLEDLRRRLDLTYIFVSHDLSVVQHISDRIGVMYLGTLVEIGDSETIFNQPAHPYTQALLRSVPIVDARQQQEPLLLDGNVPSPSNPPPGCRFHTRCPIAETICREQTPQLRQIRLQQFASCHLIDSHI